MLLTILLALAFIPAVGVFLYAAVNNKLFTTAPKDIQAAAVNWIRSFWPAYLQALLFLEAMNWYDGIVIDRLRVGHSRFWVIPGTEDLPFVQT